MHNEDRDIDQSFIWQVCLTPAAGAYGASWADMTGEWLHKTEVMYQGTKDFGDIWEVCKALGPASWPRVVDPYTEVVISPDGSMVQRNLQSGTERAVRRLEYGYGNKEGKVRKE